MPTLQRYSIILIRVFVSLIFIIHGTSRSIIDKSVGGFGSFLDSKGFVGGLYIAWFITLYEIVGGLTMASGKWVKYISAGFILHQVMGIILVHLQNGWFVVGGGTGGVEYSALIIVSLVVILASDLKNNKSIF